MTLAVLWPRRTQTALSPSRYNCSFQPAAVAFSPFVTFLYLIPSITWSPGLVVKTLWSKKYLVWISPFKKRHQEPWKSFFTQSYFKKVRCGLRKVYARCQSLLTSFLLLLFIFCYNPKKIGRCMMGWGCSGEGALREHAKKWNTYERQYSILRKTLGNIYPLSYTVKFKLFMWPVYTVL